jgi:hypothetical protein
MDFFDVFQREFIAKVLVVLVQKLIVKEVLNGDKRGLVALRVAAFTSTADSRRVTVIL